MKLELFSSKRGNPEPNLVAVQASDLDMLPTVLVCPLLAEGSPLFFLPELRINGKRCFVCVDLVRPIHRRALAPAGTLGESDSRNVMRRFSALLAR